MFYAGESHFQSKYERNVFILCVRVSYLSASRTSEKRVMIVRMHHLIIPSHSVPSLIPWAHSFCHLWIVGTLFYSFTIAFVCKNREYPMRSYAVPCPYIAYISFGFVSLFSEKTKIRTFLLRWKTLFCFMRICVCVCEFGTASLPSLLSTEHTERR